jgi:mannosyltransferase
VPAAGRRSVPQATVVLLLGLIVVGLALRLPSFNDSIWGDELSTNFVVHGFGVGDPISILKGDQEGTPPLFFLLTWLTRGIDGAEGLRIFSLLAGLAAIPLTYLLGSWTIGRPAAAVGAALIALSPFQIFYATEARAYALMMLFCLLAAIALLRALNSGRTGWWVGYGLAVAAAAYTHYTTVFVLIGLLVWAFFARPEARGPLLLTNAGAALLYVPWIPELLDDRHEPAATIIERLHPLSLTRGWNDLGQWSLGHPLIPLQELPGRLGAWLVAAGVLIAIVGLVLRARGGGLRRWWPPSAGFALVIVLVAAAPVGAVLQDIVAPSVFIPRNLISSWPGLALAVGALVTTPRAPFRVAAVAALVAGFTIGAVKMLDTKYQRPDYDGVAAFIERSSAPGDPVVDSHEPTPGPQTAMEAALAPHGQPLPRGRQVFEVGFPTFQTRLDAVRRGGALNAELPVPSSQQLAAQAVRAAGDGRLFVVGPAASLEILRSFPGPLADFLAALPPRFHEVEYRSFPGLSIFPIGVHVLDGSTGQ